MKNVLALLFAVLVMVSATYAEKQIHKYQFDYPQLVSHGEFTEIIYNNCQNNGTEGNPLLPYFNVNLLVPQGEVIVAVNILGTEQWEETSRLKIQPASKPFPISRPAQDYEVVPNDAIYNSAESYPEQIVSHTNTGFLAGHGIGSFTLCPVQWVPESGETTFLKAITIEVITAPDKKAQKSASFAKSNNIVTRRINTLVENPELLNQYRYTTLKDSNENDLLIITNEALAPDFQNFADFKSSCGYFTEIITTETIYATYDGADEQEQIRNCIIDYYTNHNTQFVILGGDSDPGNSADYIIPHRGLFAQDELDIPSDMYYCCLDGTWNEDGDNRWGESGETDLFAEVLIGRFCVDQTSEIENLTAKNIAYQTNPVTEDIEKALMLGEQLDDEPTYGGNYKDEIMNGASTNGYTTAAIADNFTVGTIYDRDMSWNKYTIFDQYNNTGINLLNHLGHSFTNYNMKMDCDDITLQNFTNDGITRGFVIGYSQGCYNGSFDNRGTSAGSYGSQDSFAEYITNLERANVACVANSRYGWYMPGSTNSSSQMYDREFFDAIFGEGITMIGAVNADSKEDNPGIFNANDNYRWVAYEANLFGDPTLDIWTAQPQDITASLPSSIIIGSPDIAINLIIENARVAITQNNELIGRGVTNAMGAVTITFNEPISSTEPLTISVMAHNYNRAEQEMVVVSNQPYVIYSEHNLNDNAGNGNGMADYSEDILLGMTLRNVGDQPSEEVTATLTTEDEFITITNATNVFGSFEAGEFITLEDAFEFTISDDIEDGHSVLFNLMATDGSMEWSSKMYMTVNAPALEYGGALIDDSNANNNGMMDAGETLDIIFTITNNGHASIEDLTSAITCASEFITINSGSASPVELINAEESVEVTINLTVAEDTPEGTQAEFVCNLDAGAYSCDDTKYFKIGLIVENFETGDFSAFNWLLAGNEPWTIVSNEVFEGQYAARSGAIGNNQLSIMQIEGVEVPGNDSIAFMVKVSTEATYDYLYFYMGDTKLGEWEGEKDWMRVAFAVPEGTHTFRWLYKKDQYETGGQDCAWVDFIELPAMDMGVGIENLDISADVFAMPNPANDQLTIRIENPVSQSLNASLQSIDGRAGKVILDNQIIQKGIHVVKANIETLPTGIYVLIMENESSRITKKIVISR